MAPRPKQSSKSSKKAKTQQGPESENDFLEAADEFESAGGKWKAGDADKALRFYNRADAVYIEGLKRYPRSFDLAYNRARLLYAVTLEKIMINPRPVENLKETLLAHKFALSLDEQNADVLFNTAQVLTSLAEEIMEEAKGEEQQRFAKDQAQNLLREAVDVFANCLSRQEVDFKELKALRDSSNDSFAQGGDEVVMENGAPLPSSIGQAATTDSTTEQWATVIEPITPQTLIDTALAQLRSLAILATVSAPTSGSSLASISELATRIYTQKLQHYLSMIPDSPSPDEEPEPQTPFLKVSSTSSYSFHSIDDEIKGRGNPRERAKLEVDLTMATFASSMADAEFRSDLVTLNDYELRIVEPFAILLPPSGSLSGKSLFEDNFTIRVWGEYVDALTTFVESLPKLDFPGTPDRTNAQLRWKALSDAEKLLQKIAEGIKSHKFPDAPNPAHIYLQRGDIEFQRYNLARISNTAVSPAVHNSSLVLLKNAGVYYRAAVRFASQSQHRDEDIKNEAGVKNLVVGYILSEKGVGNGSDMKDVIDGIENHVLTEIMSDMVDDGLIAAEDDVFILVQRYASS